MSTQKKKRLIPLMKLEDMTEAEARVRVAKDVIQQLKTEELIAACGIYINDTDGRYLYSAPYTDLRTRVGREQCRVCAVGAAALAFVKRYDGVTTDHAGYHPTAHSIASAIFPAEMRNAMEDAFEVQSLIERPEDYEGYEPCRAEDFGMQYRNPNSRLKAIFQNIIDNDGEFVP